MVLNVLHAKPPHIHSVPFLSPSLLAGTSLQLKSTAELTASFSQQEMSKENAELSRLLILLLQDVQIFSEASVLL